MAKTFLDQSPLLPRLADPALQFQQLTEDEALEARQFWSQMEHKQHQPACQGAAGVVGVIAWLVAHFRFGIGGGWSLVIAFVLAFCAFAAVWFYWAMREESNWNNPSYWFPRVRPLAARQLIERTGLTPCRECHQPISPKAATCPHCGVDKPGMDNTSAAISQFGERLYKFVRNTAVVIVVVFAIAFFTNPDAHSFQIYLQNTRTAEGVTLSSLVDEATATSRYTSFHVFSLGGVRVPFRHSTSVYLGIFGRWFPLGDHPDKDSST
jgi:uncharacterized membrane protein